MAEIRHPQENKQTKAQAVEEEIRTHTGFNISVPIRISNKYNDRLYVEYLLDSSYGKTNKLAFLRDENFDPDYIVGKSNYAEVGDNFFGSADKATFLSNEKVKHDLAREFFQYPEEYTLKVTNMVLSNIEKKYSFTSKELEEISGLDTKSAEKRNRLIKLTEDKMRIGDEALMDGLKAINSIAETYRKTIELKEKSSSKIATKKLREYIAKNAFGSTADFNWKDLGDNEKETKERIKDLAMSENSIKLEKYLNKIGYANSDKEIIRHKSKEIIKTFQIAKKSHEEIQERINLASSINSDVQLKEQFLNVADVLNGIGKYKLGLKKYSDKKITKKQLEKIQQDFSSIQKRFTGDEEAYSGILSKIDKLRMKRYEEKLGSSTPKEKEELRKPPSLSLAFYNLSREKIKTISDAERIAKKLNRFDKAISDGLTLYTNNGLKKYFNDMDIPQESKNGLLKKIKKNYENLAINIMRRENEANVKGTPFGIYEMETLHREFEKNNGKTILESTQDELSKQIISENIDKLSEIGVEIKDDIIPKVSEIMNAYNLTQNSSIDAQPDQIDIMASQSIENPAIKDSVVKSVENNVKGQDTSKGEFDHRLSEIAGSRNHLRLKKISKEFESNINRIMMPRETLARFKSCLSNSVVAKTNMETLASTSAQCADKLLTDLRQDIQRTSSYQQQLGQGLASVLPFHLLFAIREEYLHFVERDFIRSQEEIGDDMVKIMQDLNTASNESDKEARLELIHNHEQGGISFSTVHHSQANSFKNSLGKEKIAEDLAVASYLDNDRSVQDVLSDEKYKIDKEKLLHFEEEIQAKAQQEERKLSTADLDILSGGLDDVVNTIKEQDEENKSDTAKIVDLFDDYESEKKTENQKSYEEFVGVENIFETEKKEVKTPVFDDIENSSKANLQKQADENDFKQTSKYNRGMLEYALKQIDAQQMRLTLSSFDEKEYISKEEYARQINDMEKDKQIIQNELILTSLVEMEKNTFENNLTQPKSKIRDAIIKFKQAIRKPNQKKIEYNGSMIDAVALSKTDKKSIISEAMGMMIKNNKSMNNTFITLRDTNSLSTIHQKNENGVDVIQTAVGDKAYLLDVYENNKEFLQDKTNAHEKEKDIAYDAMRRLTEETSLEQKINTFDGFAEMFNEKAGNSKNLEFADRAIQGAQKNEHISSITNKMGF